ncbi:hypothetical protein TNCT_486811 [Trichonephila clavata]|uniref:Secreted protein n=1 Tax=Trichonephila clavata TaxID=2740835 RepID=A0A8X6LDN0_TRICU|nr:hypothetical protein TNCT_486811 [Trichonephila clavata]
MQKRLFTTCHLLAKICLLPKPFCSAAHGTCQQAHCLRAHLATAPFCSAQEAALATANLTKASEKLTVEKRNFYLRPCSGLYRKRMRLAFTYHAAFKETPSKLKSGFLAPPAQNFAAFCLASWQHTAFALSQNHTFWPQHRTVILALLTFTLFASKPICCLPQNCKAKFAAAYQQPLRNLLRPSWQSPLACKTCFW